MRKTFISLSFQIEKQKRIGKVMSENQCKKMSLPNEKQSKFCQDFSDTVIQAEQKIDKVTLIAKILESAKLKQARLKNASREEMCIYSLGGSKEVESQSNQESKIEIQYFDQYENVEFTHEDIADLNFDYMSEDILLGSQYEENSKEEENYSLKMDEAIRRATEKAMQIESSLVGLRNEVRELVRRMDFTATYESQSKSLFLSRQEDKPERRIQKSIKQFKELQSNISSYSSLKGQNPKRARQRCQIQRQIAEVFVTKGYGLAVAKQQIRYQMQGNRYNSILTSVIRGALRKLSEVMLKNMKQKIRKFDNNDQKLLRSPLVNCRKWLTWSEQATFFKLIKSNYGMSHQPIYKEQVIALYDKIMKQLMKRNEHLQKKYERKKDEVKMVGAVKPMESKVEKKNIKSVILQKVAYNHQPERRAYSPKTADIASEYQGISMPADASKHEKLIVELFIKFKSVQSIFIILSRRFKELIWTQEQIHQTIDKLTKIGLKKVIKARKNYPAHQQPLPSLNLNEEIVNIIVTSPTALQARIAVLQSLLMPALSPKEVQDISSTIAKTIQEHKTQ